MSEMIQFPLRLGSADSSRRRVREAAVYPVRVGEDRAAMPMLGFANARLLIDATGRMVGFVDLTASPRSVGPIDEERLAKWLDERRAVLLEEDTTRGLPLNRLDAARSVLLLAGAGVPEDQIRQVLHLHLREPEKTEVTELRYEFWRHTKSGEIYAVGLDADGRVVLASAPVHDRDFEHASRGSDTAALRRALMTAKLLATNLTEPGLAEDIEATKDDYVLVEG